MILAIVGKSARTKKVSGKHAVTSFLRRTYFLSAGNVFFYAAKKQSSKFIRRWSPGKTFVEERKRKEKQQQGYRHFCRFGGSANQKNLASLVATLDIEQISEIVSHTHTHIDNFQVRNVNKNTRGSSLQCDKKGSVIETDKKKLHQQDSAAQCDYMIQQLVTSQILDLNFNAIEKSIFLLLRVGLATGAKEVIQVNLLVFHNFLLLIIFIVIARLKLVAF